MEERIDKILVQRNLAETRVKAEKIIQEIGVKVYGKLVTKPGKKFAIDCEIDMISEDLPWVSIDSLKLIEAISNWKLTIENGNFFIHQIYICLKVNRRHCWIRKNGNLFIKIQLRYF